MFLEGFKFQTCFKHVSGLKPKICEFKTWNTHVWNLNKIKTIEFFNTLNIEIKILETKTFLWTKSKSLSFYIKDETSQTYSTLTY